MESLSRTIDNLVFTACTGRCGQFSLVEYLNEFAIGCFAEAEPPDLLYKQEWPLGNHLRKFQRKWIVTDEQLGRGKALKWFDDSIDGPLDSLARWRLNRIGRLCKKRKASTYFEASKFFIRSYGEAVIRHRPDISVVLLRRDPLENAKSFANRHKNFELDNPLPSFKKTCFPIDISHLSRFQLYLWQWVEIELRYYRFIERFNLEEIVFNTSDLNSIEDLTVLFNRLSIPIKKPINLLSPVNTNINSGVGATLVEPNDVNEYLAFLELIPPHLLDDLPNMETFIQEYFS